MTPHWQYLKYVVRHKWYVFIAATRLGIPWLGFIHDWSKFRPSEWIAYSTFFHGKSGDSDEARKRFNAAWSDHIHRNKHHWQYWILNQGDRLDIVQSMPDRYRKEMLADWIGAGKAQGHGDNTVDWYESCKHRLALHPETRTWIEAKLSQMG